MPQDVRVAVPLLNKAGNAAVLVDMFLSEGYVKHAVRDLVEESVKAPENPFVDSSNEEDWLLCEFTKTGKTPSGGFYRVCHTCMANSNRSELQIMQQGMRICLMCSEVSEYCQGTRGPSLSYVQVACN